MKQFLYISVLLTLFSGIAHAQSSNNDMRTISTAAPFLSISPDARGAAMGNVGAATLPDAASQYWNPAKYALTTEKAGIQLNYTPWLTKITDNSYDTYLSGYFRFDSVQSISASIHYYNYGDEIAYKDDNNNFIGTHKPYEFAIDAAYSRKLGKYISGAVAFRYIRSEYAKNIGTTTGDVKAGQAVAADLAMYYLRPIQIFSEDFQLGIGLNLSNIGTKISYSDNGSGSFLPMNMRLGGMLSYALAENHQFSLALDFNKLLVPSSTDDDPSVISSIFTSFGDADGGFSEEIKEISTSVGLEYTYANLASLRCGYFEQSKQKGSSSFFSFGGGIIYKMVNLDVAYLMSTSSRTILGNTFKISLGVKF